MTKNTPPVLKCSKEIIIKVDSDDLEQYIKKVTGYKYEIVPNEEWSNDSQHSFRVRDILDDSEKKIGIVSKTMGTMNFSI